MNYVIQTIQKSILRSPPIRGRPASYASFCRQMRWKEVNKANQWESSYVHTVLSLTFPSCGFFFQLSASASPFASASASTTHDRDRKGLACCASKIISLGRCQHRSKDMHREHQTLQRAQGVDWSCHCICWTTCLPWLIRRILPWPAFDPLSYPPIRRGVEEPKQDDAYLSSTTLQIGNRLSKRQKDIRCGGTGDEQSTTIDNPYSIIGWSRHGQTIMTARCSFLKLYEYHDGVRTRGIHACCFWQILTPHSKTTLLGINICHLTALKRQSLSYILERKFQRLWAYITSRICSHFGQDLGSNQGGFTSNHSKFW